MTQSDDEAFAELRAKYGDDEAARLIAAARRAYGTEAPVIEVTREHRELAILVLYPEGSPWARENEWVITGQGPVNPLLVRIAKALASACRVKPDPG